jgi:sphingomyelin phosphodiesterase acid-like 3
MENTASKLFNKKFNPLINATILLLISFAVQADSFLILSDIHLRSNASHTMDLDPKYNSLGNELDPATFQAILSSINSAIKTKVINPDFTLILGDISAHYPIYFSMLPQLKVKDETLVFGGLKNSLPNQAMFYAFGNNDSLAGHYENFTNKNNISPVTIAKLHGKWNSGFLSTGKICNNSKNMQYPCLLDSNEKLGYYSAYIKPKLRLITLNSVMFSSKRQHISTKLAFKELAWLRKELNVANKNHELVILAMHIPPIYDHNGKKHLWMQDNYAEFISIVSQYQKNIIAITAGHTHQSQSTNLHTKRGNIPLIINGALTTTNAQKPVMTIVNYDGDKVSAKVYYVMKKNHSLYLQEKD